MSRSLVERRLTEVSARLRQLREELAVSDEQLQHLDEVADDTRLRSLVSETPPADRAHHDPQRHADAMTRPRAEIIEEGTRLRQTQAAPPSPPTDETKEAPHIYKRPPTGDTNDH